MTLLRLDFPETISWQHAQKNRTLHPSENLGRNPKSGNSKSIALSALRRSVHNVDMDEAKKAHAKTEAEHAGKDLGKAAGITAEVLAHGLEGTVKGLADGIESVHTEKSDSKE